MPREAATKSYRMWKWFRMGGWKERRLKGGGSMHKWPREAVTKSYKMQRGFRREAVGWKSKAWWWGESMNRRLRDAATKSCRIGFRNEQWKLEEERTTNYILNNKRAVGGALLVAVL
jgi:hypothetical protein